MTLARAAFPSASQAASGPRAGEAIDHDLRRRLWRLGFALLPCLVLIGALALRAADPPAIEDIRFWVFDNLQRLKPRSYQPAPVAVVDLDDETLARHGQWPWPRNLVADLVGRLQEAGAAAIALDIVFAEPDRLSPGRILPLWPESPETDALRRLAESGALPDHDRILAQTIARGGVVTGFALSAGDSPDSPAAVAPPSPAAATPPADGIGAPVRPASFATAGADPGPFLLAYDAAIGTLPELARAAAGNGSINVQPERDGVIRRVPLLLVLGSRLYPSLALEALRVAQDARTYVVKSSGASGVISFGERSGLAEIKVGAVTVPTDRRGRLWLYDTGPEPQRVLPAWRVLASGFDPARVAGHVVMIGTSAAGLKDLRATPLDPAAPGISVHAQLIEQMLLQDYLIRPDWAAGAELVFVLLLGGVVVLSYLLHRLGAIWLAVITMSALAGAVGLSWYAFAGHGLLLDPVYPAAAVLGTYLTASLLRYLRSENERKWIRQAFGLYMAPALVERLAERPELLRLGGEMRELTLLFCDVRGFTAISEQFDATELTHFINRFLTPMTDIIMAVDGYVDKYMGDCIMAIWNAPIDVPDHADRACRAALRMRDGVAALNARLGEEAAAVGRRHVPVRVGIGLNSGLCCVGNMGSEQRFNYSALGDDVNLASRLEGQCKTYGLDTILGERTWELAPRMAIMEIDLIQVQGKTQPARIFTLLGDDGVAEDAGFVALRARQADMLAAFRAQRWQEARVLVAECRKLAAPFDIADLYDLYEGRIAYYERNPPDPAWDGVFVSVTK